MSNVLSDQRARADVSLRRKRMRNATLWTIQGGLALLFLFTGSVKLIVPVNILLAQMAVPLPGLFIRFIGVIEVAGALGLILPGLTRIKPFLTSLAACGLALEMIGATTITVIGMGVGPALMPLLVGLLAAAVASGRRPGRRSA
jgi:hypothetical protein